MALVHKVFNLKISIVSTQTTRILSCVARLSVSRINTSKT